MKKLTTFCGLWLLASSAASAAECINGINAVNCTVPAGFNSVLVEAWGGGGGGSSSSDAIGGGGGGGSYCAARFAVTQGSLISISIGVGGLKGYDFHATNGGSSTVSSAEISGIQASGGQRGSDGAGGAGGGVSSCTALGSSKFSGGRGGLGNFIGQLGGGGGGSAFPNANGNDGVAEVGGTGTGNGSNGTSNVVADSGGVPGGGGGGSFANNATLPGNGGAGQVRLAFSQVNISQANIANVPTLSDSASMLLVTLVGLLTFGNLRKRRQIRL